MSRLDKYNLRSIIHNQLNIQHTQDTYTPHSPPIHCRNTAKSIHISLSEHTMKMNFWNDITVRNKHFGDPPALEATSQLQKGHCRDHHDPALAGIHSTVIRLMCRGPPTRKEQEKVISGAATSMAKLVGLSVQSISKKETLWLVYIKQFLKALQ